MNTATHITHITIFDGDNEQLKESMSVLVEGNTITGIAKKVDLK